MSSGEVRKAVESANRWVKNFDIRCNIWIQENMPSVAKLLIEEEEISAIEDYKAEKKLEKVWGSAIDDALRGF